MPYLPNQVPGSFGLESVSTNEEPYKTSFAVEGTAVSYGQSFYVVEEAVGTVVQNTTTSQAITEGLTVNSTQQQSTAELLAAVISDPNIDNNVVLPVGQVNNVVNLNAATVTEFATVEGLNPAWTTNIIASPVLPVVNTHDILVNLIASTEDTDLNCKSSTSIAQAAVSTNQNASAVVSPSVLGIQSSDADIVGSNGIGTLATLAPTVSGIAIVEGSNTKTQEEIQEALEESAKVDLSITLRSKHSEKIDFNNVKVPVLAGRFVYNFFVEEEGDIETQEDPALDPLLSKEPYNVPRYVELIWSIAEVTEPLKGTESAAKENASFRRSVFYDKRGVTGYKTPQVPFALGKSKKKYVPYVMQGLNKKVPDIHSPETAIKSVQNKAAFNNTVTVTLNISDEHSHVSDLPFESLTDA